MTFQTGLLVFSGGGPHLTPLDGFDGDGNPILYGISGHPAKGAASIGTADGGLFHPDEIGTVVPILMFDPGTDFDDLLEGEIAAVSITLSVVGGGEINIILAVMKGADPNPPDNQPPQFLTNYIPATVDTEGAASIDLSAHCVDVEGDPITYGIITQPGTGTATLSGSTITYSGGKPLAQGDTTTFLVKATSNNEIATATVVITGINDPPVFLVPTIGFTLPVGAAGIYEVSLDLSAFVEDPDEGDSLVYAITSPPTNGIASITGWVLGYLGTGGDSIGVSVTDSHGETDTAVVVVSIDQGDGQDPPPPPPPPGEDPDPDVNNPPEWLVNPINFILPDAGAIAIDLSIYVTDVDGDNLTYAIVTPPTVGTASIQGSILTYLGKELAEGETANIGVSARDTFNATATATVVITGVNDPPRFLTDHPIVVTVDAEGAASIDLSTYLEDPDNGEILAWGVVGRPGLGKAKITGTVLNYSGGKPLAEGEETYVVVAVVDSHHEEAEITVVVTGINDPPEFTIDSIELSIPVNEEGRIPQKIDLSAYVEDPDNGDVLTYAIVTPPALGTASISGNILTYLGGDGSAIGVSVTDSHGESDTATVVPTVIRGEDPGGEDPGGEDPGGEDPGGDSIPDWMSPDIEVNIASPTLYPRESTGSGGEYTAYFVVLPTASTDRIEVAWRVYEAPVTQVSYNGFGDVSAIESGIKFGKAEFNASGIAGLQTSVVFWLTRAHTDPSDPSFREKIEFSENRALAWINPVPGTTPPDTVVFAPSADPVTFEKFQSDPIVFSVGAANGGKESITVTYKIEHQPVVDLSKTKARGYSTTGSLTFPPGDSTQTVEFSPLIAIQQKWNSQVMFQLTGAGGKPYWPVPLIVPIVEPTEDG